MRPSICRQLGATLGLAALALIAFGSIAGSDPAVSGEEHCVVNVRSDDRLNMRTQPNPRAATVARKRHNECGILVHNCRRNWCRVEDGHSLGWVNRHFIAMVSPPIYCVVGVPRGDALNLRAFPSAQSRVLTRPARRQCNIAFLPYAVGGWQKVRVAGWQGWVNRRYLSGE